MALLTDEQKAALAAQYHQEDPLALVHLANPLQANWHVYLYAGKADGDDFICDLLACTSTDDDYTLESGSMSLKEMEMLKFLVDDDWDPLPVEEQYQRMHDVFESGSAFKPWYHHPKTA